MFAEPCYTDSQLDVSARTQTQTHHAIDDINRSSEVGRLEPDPLITREKILQ